MVRLSKSPRPNLQKNRNFNLDKRNLDTTKPTPAFDELRKDREEEPFTFIETVPAHDNLVPLGFGIYASPDEPVDPGNCEQWSDSPICGGNPFTLSLIGIEPSIVLDECNVGIQLQGSLFFYKLPEFQWVHRKEECRVEEEEQPFNYDNVTQKIPTDFPDLDPNSIAIVGLARFFYQRTEEYWDGVYHESKNWEGIKSPKGTKPGVTRGVIGNRIYTSLVDINYTLSRYSYRNEAWKNRYGGTFTGFNPNLPDINEIWYLFETQAPTRPISEIQLFSQTENRPSGTQISILKGRYGSIKDYFKEGGFQQTKTVGTNASGVKFEFIRTSIVRYEVIYVDLIPNLKDPRRFPPPPPPPPRNCFKCMSCCQSPKSPDANQLLRLILSKLDNLEPAEETKDDLEKIKKAVGVYDFEANDSIPNLINDDNSGDFIPTSIPQIQVNILKNLDAWFGKFDEITIEDTDITEEGNQTKKVRLMNVAEALSELVGLSLINKTNIDAIVKTTFTNLIETGSVKQSANLNYHSLQAITDYLAFEFKQVQKEVKYSFNPQAERLVNAFEPTTQKINTIENVDKQDLKDQFFHLLNAAAIIRAVFFQKLDGENATQQVKDILTRDESSEDSQTNGEVNFDQFTELAETQFGSLAGSNQENSINPYGRNYERRPRIREIGKDPDGSGDD